MVAVGSGLIMRYANKIFIRLNGINHCGRLVRVSNVGENAIAKYWLCLLFMKPENGHWPSISCSTLPPSSGQNQNVDKYK